MKNNAINTQDLHILRGLFTRPIKQCDVRHESYALDTNGQLNLLPQCDEESRHGGCLHLIAETIDEHLLLNHDLLQYLLRSEVNGRQQLISARGTAKEFDQNIRALEQHIAFVRRDEELKKQSQNEIDKMKQKLRIWLSDVWDPLRKKIVEKIDEYLAAVESHEATLSTSDE